MDQEASKAFLTARAVRKLIVTPLNRDSIADLQEANNLWSCLNCFSSSDNPTAFFGSNISNSGRPLKDDMDWNLQ